MRATINIGKGAAMALPDGFIEALEKMCKVRSGEAVAAMDPGVDMENLGAGVVACPASTHDVQAIVLLCREHRVPIVTHGGRTGLARAGVSEPGQLVVDMSGMNRMGKPDPVAGCIEVEAGATLHALQEACRAVGRTPGIDLAARGSATIGGMISTNAGGMEAFRCGVMRHRVLGLEAVLPDGTVMSDMTRITKVNEGLDIKHLLIGAEGRLGIVTRAVLKLEPLEQAAATALAGFASGADAVTAFHAMRAGGGLLRAEVMWRAYVDIVSKACGLPEIATACGGDVLVLFEVAGSSFEDAQGRLEASLEKLADGGVLADGVIAQNMRQQQDFWRVREDSFAVESTWPNGLWYDVTVPLDQLDAYAKGLQDRVASLPGECFLSVIGHLGDGNLHITVCVPAGATLTKTQADEAVFHGLKQMGGSISAEHGIGLEKMEALARYGDPGRLSAARVVARALDPLGLMNPGKVQFPEP
jgi:FAD/FMN-containing dehydrogenase